MNVAYGQIEGDIELHQVRVDLLTIVSYVIVEKKTSVLPFILCSFDITVTTTSTEKLFRFYTF